MLNIYVLDGKRIGFISKNGVIKSNPREAYSFRNTSSKLFDDTIKKLKKTNYVYGILRGMKSKAISNFIMANEEIYNAVVNIARKSGLVIIPFVPILDRKMDRLYLMVANIRNKSVRNIVITSSGILIDTEGNTKYKILLHGKEVNGELENIFNRFRYN